MAFTTADLATIETAIATGAMRVKFADGREVTYQTGADLLRARDAILSSINAESATPVSRITRVVHVRT
jgi:hypothetical protein